MLSLIVITKNEEANICRCLDSVSWVDEIIVIDSGSSDNTVAIAQEFTEHVYVSEDWQGYGVQKQRALNLASGNWILHLDADESVSDELRQAIEAGIESNKADGFRIPIRLNFYNKLLRYSCSPKRHIRLFKREGAKFSDDIVHEKIVLPADWRIEKIKFPILHHSFQDVSHALAKINRYSSYSARVRAKNKKAPSFIAVLASTAWMFMRCFWLQRWFLDGRAGYLLAIISAQGTFYRGMKQIYPDSQLEKLPETKIRE